MDLQINENSAKDKSCGKQKSGRILSWLHGLKWLVFWFTASHSITNWAAYMSAEPNFDPIDDSSLNVSYARLNKFGNDTSLCPRQRSDKITIMDDPKYSFMTWPRICLDETPEMVVMVLTAPKNFDSRSKIRETLYEFNVNSTNKVKPLFLIGGSGGGLDTLQASIDNEVKANGDILQSSVYEGYGLLSFKTNVGYIWSSCFCPKTKYVMKVDDNAEINYSILLQQLKTKNGPDGGLPFGAIFCPSPMRNMRPWYPRPSGGFKTVMGKWSVKTYEMSRRVYPDFCPGWAYVTSPATGIRLAEMSANLPENLKRLKRLDDIFFSGVTREHVEGTRVEQLSGEGTWMGSLWNDHLSYCPFLGITKNMFFNDVVIAKKTTIDMQGGWFLWCAFWEYFILDPGEFLLPDILPNWMIKMCHR